ncbi:MAG: chalcone isomerase family protein [Burkholderiaceae bacterium]|nr:chalcone isomerase family protein [Burkholderiaceae bacterium]
MRAYVADAQLAGEGRLTWLGFTVYDARLFVPLGFDARDPTVQRFVLELTYARRFAGQSIADTSRDELARLGYGSESDRERWHRAMARIFPDVDKGRRIAGVHLPGRGARFYVDGVFAGAIEEAEFARGFFAIWLDERTRAPALRARLLRLAEPRVQR